MGGISRRGSGGTLDVEVEPRLLRKLSPQSRKSSPRKRSSVKLIISAGSRSGNPSLSNPGPRAAVLLTCKAEGLGEDTGAFTKEFRMQTDGKPLYMHCCQNHSRVDALQGRQALLHANTCFSYFQLMSRLSLKTLCKLRAFCRCIIQVVSVYVLVRCDIC